MQVEHEFVVAAPVDTVRVLLTDPDRSTACVPGLTVETFAPGEYGGRLRLRVGSTTVTYRGTAAVSPGDTVRLDLDGQEVRGSGIAKGTLTMSLSGEGESTRVGIDADISVTGRLGSLDPAVLEDALRRLFARFGECIGAAAMTDGVETEPATGPEGGLVTELAATPSPGTTGQASSPTVEVAATPFDAPRRELAMTGAGDDDLLADQGRRVWPLPPAVGLLMALTATGLLGVVIWLLRRRRA
jgi:carbon monoxide dehydrogenase subunit G